MSVSDYKAIQARSVEELNTAVAAAIADGYQPEGAAFVQVHDFGQVLVQTMIKGVAENLSDVGATIATYGDVVTHDAADFATAAQGTKADNAAVASTTTTALALKAPLAAPVFTGGAVLATGASHTVDDVIAALQVRGIVKQS